MAEPSFLRRLFLCRFDLCDLWYRKDDGSRKGYACAGCDRSSMMQTPPRAPCGGPTEISPPGRIYVIGGGEQPPILVSVAPSLDELPATESEPVVGYVSAPGWRIFNGTEGWSTSLYRDQRDLAPRGGIVEVEVRFRRVVE